MITTRQLGKNGRLGNQLFQIAAVIGTAFRNQDIPVFFKWEYEGHFARQLPKLTPLARWFQTTFETYNEPRFEYTEIPKTTANLDLQGYFQSDKYFKTHAWAIRNQFEPNPEAEEYLFKKYKFLLARHNIVGMHVRRGDYLGIKDYHPVLGLDYYERALKEFDEKTVVVVFSDDIKWCKQQEFFCQSSMFCIEGEQDIMDLFFMSFCTDQIIANSSFSWWAAWLNKNPDKKVIAPKKWFGPACEHNTKDLLPEGWITV